MPERLRPGARPVPGRRPRRVIRSALPLAAVAVLLGPAGAGALTAAAEIRDVRLTQDGPEPDRLVLEPGDRVRFVNDDTFVHRAIAAGPGWDLDTGTLVPGQSHIVPEPLTSPGTYAYRGADLDEFTGSVVVPDEEGDVPAGTPDVQPAGSTAPSPGGTATSEDRPPSLRTPVPARRFGLPSVLALLAAAGVLSLLVRVLLAETPPRSPHGA
ncbi:MAG: hypothetical protein M3P93_15695 [Actinomycetota bacterium]|nr:hypothetical protein [Actinomycetota bacterium]